MMTIVEGDNGSVGASKPAETGLVQKSAVYETAPIHTWKI